MLLIYSLHLNSSVIDINKCYLVNFGNHCKKVKCQSVLNDFRSC